MVLSGGKGACLHPHAGLYPQAPPRLDVHFGGLPGLQGCDLHTVCRFGEHNVTSRIKSIPENSFYLNASLGSYAKPRGT